ncbi:MAG TPA: ribonuclease Y [Patescibacteria group bacterium]|nr:ribonuclease Y [Patescibacteria group bacterium]
MDDKQKYHKKLEEISHISMEQAKKLILDEARLEAAADISKIIRESEDEAKLTSAQKAREILADSLQHGTLDLVPEYTVSVIKIQDEEVKGRIIGKEGRNIRAFETATGVDVGLDEEGLIRLSSFDSVRREIARRSLELLIKDTRIQPVRIEEVVEQQKKEVSQILFEEGQKIAEDAGVFNVHPDLLSYLGRFKFRTSFGQNLIIHSLEVSKIAAHLAAEIGANVEIAKIGGLFHDIGKVVADKEGSHVQLGVELLQKYKMPREIINAVGEHHQDKPFTSVESVLVYLADAASGGRPGARHEDVEEYVKRIKDMEQIAKNFKGVMDAYAFEAGRELRVVIDPGKLDDIETTITAKQIKDEIDRKLIIPGVVRVTAIREFRTSEPKE